MTVTAAACTRIPDGGLQVSFSFKLLVTKGELEEKATGTSTAPIQVASAGDNLKSHNITIMMIESIPSPGQTDTRGRPRTDSAGRSRRRGLPVPP